MDLLTDFAINFLLAWAANVTILLVTGFVLLRMNAAHPERKIQTRPQTHSHRKDILSSVWQLANTAVCLSVAITAQTNGLTPAPVAATWWSVPLFFVISIVLHDAWFYWTHRALHTKALYRFHKPHHLTVTPSVFSNDAGGSVDTYFAHSYYALVVFVLPIPLVALLAHRVVEQVSAMAGHAGHEHFASPTARKPWPMLCTTYHDQHHSEFVWNYANFFSFWDRVCGTIHPHYDRIVEGWESGARPPMPKAKQPVE